MYLIIKNKKTRLVAGKQAEAGLINQYKSDI